MVKMNAFFSDLLGLFSQVIVYPSFPSLPHVYNEDNKALGLSNKSGAVWR